MTSVSHPTHDKRKQAIAKVNEPSLNRNLGKFLLPPVWDPSTQGHTPTTTQVTLHSVPAHPLHMDHLPTLPQREGGTNLF